jgi:hypothetical protein
LEYSEYLKINKNNGGYKMGNIKIAFDALLRSRKFWLAVLGVINTIVAHYFAVPEDVWQAINALLLVVIAGITIEDAATKINSSNKSSDFINFK